MQPELISRIVALVKKHGDRMVLADEQTGEAVVVIPLDAYERLVGMGVGRNPLVQQAAPAPVSQQVQASRPQEEPRERPFRGLTTEEVMAKVGEQVPAQRMAPPAPTPAPQSAPSQPVAQAPQDGRDDEERFYLEPIE